MDNKNSVVLLNFYIIGSSKIQKIDTTENRKISPFLLIKKYKVKITETKCCLRLAQFFTPLKEYVLKDKGIFLSIFSALIVALGGIFYKKAKTLSGKIILKTKSSIFIINL